MKEFTIGKNEAGQRFDKYLAKLLPNAPKSFIYKMLRKKNITLNGKKALGNEMLALTRRTRNSPKHILQKRRLSIPLILLPVSYMRMKIY